MEDFIVILYHSMCVRAACAAVQGVRPNRMAKVRRKRLLKSTTNCSMSVRIERLMHEAQATAIKLKNLSWATVGMPKFALFWRFGDALGMLQNN